jgi:CubicO group peptidase (beta-lactamase class C family)
MGEVRRRVLIAAASLLLSSAAIAQPVFPGREWQPIDAARAGWSSDKLKAAGRQAQAVGATAVMVVHDGRLVLAWGDVARRVHVASVRKSFLSALYGIGVADGRIDTGKTLRDLGIDDRPPRLTAIEKTARVRDLLMARSGVYHAAAFESSDQKQRRPARGSHRPGTFWYYNNWDFNALGTIWRQRTGEDIFVAVEQRIARPIGMQDFSAGDGRYVFESVSDHPAYRMEFTARDLARFGWLYLNKGSWTGRQVVPAAWVADSTRPHSDARPGLGYGLMWWAAKSEVQLQVRVGPGSFSARGAGGQYVLVLPAYNLVVVHLHERPYADESRAGEVLKLILEAAPSRQRR